MFVCLIVFVVWFSPGLARFLQQKGEQNEVIRRWLVDWILLLFGGLSGCLFRWVFAGLFGWVLLS